MYVRYNENGEIVGVFINCKPSDQTGFIEVADDDAAVMEYLKKNGTLVKDTPTQEERITALEEALTAIEEGIASV